MDNPDNDLMQVEQELVNINFNPNKPQRHLLENFKRFNIFECHRRAGKSYLACIILIMSALGSKYPNARYAMVAPEEKQGDRNVADTLIDLAHGVPGCKYYKSDKKLVFPNGAQIYLLGIKNEDALRGGFWDGMVLDEFRDLKNAEYAWNSVIYPSINKWESPERQGWILITSTPPQLKHFYTEIYNRALKSDSWYVEKFPITETGLFTENQIEEMRQAMTPTAFAIEMMCSHSIPAEGAFYTESIMMAEEQNRVSSKYIHDPSKGVFVSFDFGIDGTAIWFAQKHNNEFHIIDYHQDIKTDKKVTHFINLLKSKPYSYNQIYLPHDTTKRSILSDSSVLKVVKGSFGDIVKYVRREKIDVGIHRVNTELYRCYFNADNCSEGLQALREYTPKMDSTKSSFTNKIEHNWASHGADSFRYLIKGLLEFGSKGRFSRYFNKYESSSTDMFDFEAF